MKSIVTLKEELLEEFGKDCFDDVRVKILLHIYEGLAEINRDIHKIYNEI